MAKGQYWTCPYCGSNLDHGETCDCKKEEEQRVKEAEKKYSWLHVEKSGQLTLLELAS